NPDLDRQAGAYRSSACAQGLARGPCRAGIRDARGAGSLRRRGPDRHPLGRLAVPDQPSLARLRASHAYLDSDEGIFLSVCDAVARVVDSSIYLLHPRFALWHKPGKASHPRLLEESIE